MAKLRVDTNCRASPSGGRYLTYRPLTLGQGEIYVLRPTSAGHLRTHTQAPFCRRSPRLYPNHSARRSSQRVLDGIISGDGVPNGLVSTPMPIHSKVSQGQGIHRRDMQKRHRKLPHPGAQVLPRSAWGCATRTKKRTGVRNYTKRSAWGCAYSRKSAYGCAYRRKSAWGCDYSRSKASRRIQIQEKYRANPARAFS